MALLTHLDAFSRLNIIMDILKSSLIREEDKLSFLTCVGITSLPIRGSSKTQTVIISLLPVAPGEPVSWRFCGPVSAHPSPHHPGCQ